MLNATDERRILEHLKNDRKTELMPHDLNEILEQELSKPEEEIDSQLVREIMELLETKAPSSAEKEACWKAVQRETKRKRPIRCQTLLRWMCAAAAALVVVFLISFETARALNWTFLLKHLGPVAETFGLYSMSSLDQDSGENHDAYTRETLDYKQLSYDSLEEMPAQMKGQNIIPGWIPERFQFVSGTIYEDESMESASLYFRSGEDDYLTLILTFYANDEDVTSYMYEITTADENNMEVANHTLTYYFNDDGEIRAVSAIEENAHFYIGGSISAEELEQIVASMNRS